MAAIVVAGNVNLDLIPRMEGDVHFSPGALIEVGEMALRPGGCAANTGIALARLGASVRMVALLGDDAFGRWLQDDLARYGGAAEGLVTVTHGATSYSVVVSSRDHDRTFLHHPGCSGEFGPEHVSEDVLRGAEWLHLGYPPLMRRLYADGGEAVRTIFNRARALGARTSLDMSVPDPQSESGRVDWRAWLDRVLSATDVFVPSLAEARAMLGEATPDTLLDRMLGLGARTVGLKLGADGLMLATAEFRVHQPAWPVTVVNTTGAGDAAYAGLIFALHQGADLTAAARSAAAVGAACCESPEGTSGLPDWPTIAARMECDRPA